MEAGKEMLCFFVLLLCFGTAPAQTPDISGILAGNKAQYIREQLYVHTDKDSYTAREIMWFRIYSLDGFYNKQGAFSKIAYVEILDKNNLPVVQQKVSLKSGESNGSVVIPSTIASGVYKFRAYTSWMKNYGAETFFEKSIRIINPRNLDSDSVNAKRRYDIQFFPEGGNLVQQLSNRVAFRITDNFGMGLRCTGSVINADGDTVAKFQPLHLGLGNFSFTPVPGQSYKAIILFPNGDQIVRDLPGAETGGLIMNTTKGADSQLVVHVQSSPDFNGQAVSLFVHGKQQSIPVQKASLNGNQAEFILNGSQLEDGINQITLLNSGGQAICERLYFKYPASRLQIRIGAGPTYGIRKKVDLNISTKDQQDNPLPANMSMAVYRIDSLQPIDETDIQYYFYLTAELGPLESPAFYFSDSIRANPENIDNLMLTHGWRRYDWKKLVREKPMIPEYPLEFDGHIIKGKVINTRTHTAVPDADAYLSVPSARTQFSTTRSDSNGLVKFQMRGFYGSQELITEVNTVKDTVSQVEIESPFLTKYSSYPLPKFSFVSGTSATLLDRSIQEQVQHIYAGSKSDSFVLQLVDTNGFYVVPDERYWLDNYTRFLTMEEVMREYVKSSNVFKKKDKLQVYLFDTPHDNFFDRVPLILIDGVPFFDADEFFQQDPKKISRLDLVTKEYILGDQVFAGVLNATTYAGDLNGIQINAHATVLDYPGIPEQREFFAPEYETEKQISSRMPDYRTLLFWSPEFVSDTDGKTKLRFFTSDIPGNYVGVIQGLAANGLPGSTTIRFDVKK